MKKEDNSTLRPVNVLMFLNFRELVDDGALDELFYPPSEHIPNTILTDPTSHPLHPQFTPPRQLRRGLLAPDPPPFSVDAEKLTSDRERRVREHWEMIRKHGAYRTTAVGSHYQSALKTFNRLKTRQPAAYGHIYADFQFVRIAVWHVGTFVGASRHGAPASKERAAAIGHIDALLNDIDHHSVGFDEFARTFQLVKTLEALKVSLQSRKRRPREDSAKPFRDFNVALAEDLIRTFGVASPEIVKHLARSAGCTMDERTIEGHVELARTRMKSVANVP